MLNLYKGPGKGAVRGARVSALFVPKETLESLTSTLLSVRYSILGGIEVASELLRLSGPLDLLFDEEPSAVKDEISVVYGFAHP